MTAFNFISHRAKTINSRLNQMISSRFQGASLTAMITLIILARYTYWLIETFQIIYRSFVQGVGHSQNHILLFVSDGLTHHEQIYALARHAEFTAKINLKGGAMIFWVDYMKWGRLSNALLNDSCELVSQALNSRPASSVAIIVIPYLVSQHTRSGQYGELKFFALQFMSTCSSWILL